MNTRTKAAVQARPSKKAAPSAGSAWRRAPSDQSMTELLGLRLRQIREARGLTLTALSTLSGLPAATLSRIENNKMSPTFAVLARVMTGLEVDWADVVGAQQLAPGERLVSFASAGSGQATDIRNSRATVLHSHEVAHCLPLVVDIRTRDIAEMGGLSGHRGEEFCYVLSGTLMLHLEGQAPRRLAEGASALFDSSIPHAYLNGGRGPARVLLVVVRGDRKRAM